MAFHYYTGSDILANRGSPHFGAESPDGRLGPLMAPAKMAMAGNWQWQWQWQWQGQANFYHKLKSPEGIKIFPYFLAYIKIKS